MPRRPVLTLSLYLQNKRVLLIGSALGLQERTNRLLAAGAKVKRLTEEAFRAEHCEGVFALIVHSESPEFHMAAVTAARAHGCLCNIHDKPDLSDFSFPALVQRGPLNIAISTDSVAPALAARLRHEISALLERSAANFDSLLQSLETVRASMPTSKARRDKLRSMAASVRIVGEIEVNPDQRE